MLMTRQLGLCDSDVLIRLDRNANQYCPEAPSWRGMLEYKTSVCDEYVDVCVYLKS